MKRIITAAGVILALILVFLSFVGEAALILRPYDNYYSVQNPPDFSWPYTANATYSIKVAKNYALTENVREVTGLEKNLYNFTEAFEPGEYYWSYKVNNGAYSTPIRFYIAENAVSFTDIPDINNITLPQEHPRLILNSKTIPLLKQIGKKSPAYIRLLEDAEYDNSTKKNIEDNIPVCPGNIGTSYDQITAKYVEPAKKAASIALLYHITGEEKYKNYAIRYLNALSLKNSETGLPLWNPETIFTWNSTNDVCHAIFVEYVAYCYDWMYNFLSEEERRNAEDLIDITLKRPYENWANDDISSLYKTFLGTHIYRLNQCLIGAISIYDRTDENSYAHKIVSYHLPVVINFTQPFSYQDGGGAQGNFYGMGNELESTVTVLESLGILNIHHKPILDNMAYRFLYLWNAGETSAFGDNSSTKPSETYQYKSIVQSIASNNSTPVMRRVSKWILNDATNGEDYYIGNYLNTALNAEKTRDIKEAAPDMLPASKYFKDIGWVSMNSSLEDKKRVSMRFKSSPYGSYNHSHPDQNSFVISAFGEYLAIDSDYYNSYHSTFDLAWNKKTYAHNAITYDGGNGQPYNMSSANGYISDFVTSDGIDFTAGDATAAYNRSQNGAAASNLSKAKRNIIYLKPDVFIVVDDLASASGEKSFEFWLQTKGEFAETSGNSATVSQNGVYMFSDAIYPEVTSTVYNGFVSPDGAEVTPVPSIANDAEDKRIMFKTDPVSSTKMINVISVAKSAQKPCTAVKTVDENGKVIILNVLDNTSGKTYTIYINNGNSGNISTGNIVFNGDIAVVSEDDILLANGTYLEIDGEEYISSEVKASVSLSEDKVSLSSIMNDASIRVKTGDVSGIHKTEDEKEVLLSEGISSYGVKYENENGYTSFDIYPGAYNLNLNERLHEGYVKINVVQNDGGNVSCSGSLRVLREGNETRTFTILPDEGYYIKSVTFNGEKAEVGNSLEYTTGIITENSELRVVFDEITASSAPEIETYKNVFADFATDKFGPSAIVFGKLHTNGIPVKEYGIIYSYSANGFDLGNVDGKSIRKIKYEGGLRDDGYFGVEIIDHTPDQPEALYARAYVIYGDNDMNEGAQETTAPSEIKRLSDYLPNEFSNSAIQRYEIIPGVAYGDVVSFVNESYGADSDIKNLSYPGGIYPQFSPEITEYIIGTSDGSIDGLEAVVENGANAVVTNSRIIGDKAIIEVTSVNGNKKQYKFRLTDTSLSQGSAVASENTIISLRDSEKNIDAYASSGISDLVVYVYRYNKDADKYPIIRFNLKEINCLAPAIRLEIMTSSISSSLKSLNVAFYGLDCKDGIPVTGASYVNTLGCGNMVIGEKLGVVPLSDASSSGKRLIVDVTDYIRRKYLEGEDEVTFLLDGDESTWASDEKDTSSDRGLKNLYIRSKKYGTAANRPMVTWEGE